MKYDCSSMSFGIDLNIIDKFEKIVLSRIQDEVRFETEEFDCFSLVFHYDFPDSKDKIQVSKKEKVIYLGVNISTGLLTNKELSDEEKVKHYLSRVKEVIGTFEGRLIKLGLKEW